MKKLNKNLPLLSGVLGLSIVFAANASHLHSEQIEPNQVSKEVQQSVNTAEIKLKIDESLIPKTKERVSRIAELVNSCNGWDYDWKLDTIENVSRDVELKQAVERFETMSYKTGVVCKNNGISIFPVFNAGGVSDDDIAGFRMLAYIDHTYPPQLPKKQDLIYKWQRADNAKGFLVIERTTDDWSMYVNYIPYEYAGSDKILKVFRESKQTEKLEFVLHRIVFGNTLENNTKLKMYDRAEGDYLHLEGRRKF